jgi:hypothetical protein
MVVPGGIESGAATALATGTIAGAAPAAGAVGALLDGAEAEFPVCVLTCAKANRGEIVIVAATATAIIERKKDIENTPIRWFPGSWILDALPKIFATRQDCGAIVHRCPGVREDRRDLVKRS